MLLWTIQKRQAYEILMEEGVLRAEKKHIVLPDCEFAYRWLAEQMKRIGIPPAGVSYPIWAWYQWAGKRKRVDMRTHGRGWCEKTGTPITLLTIDVPDEMVLLSDFDLWHCVLNDGEIIYPYDDDVVYTQAEKEESWNNIFDITRSYAGEEHKDLYTQATFWELRKEWVVKAEHFISR